MCRCVAIVMIDDGITLSPLYNKCYELHMHNVMLYCNYDYVHVQCNFKFFPVLCMCKSPCYLFTLQVASGQERVVPAKVEVVLGKIKTQVSVEYPSLDNIDT